MQLVGRSAASKDVYLVDVMANCEDISTVEMMVTLLDFLLDVSMEARRALQAESKMVGSKDG